MSRVDKNGDPEFEPLGEQSPEDQLREVIGGWLVEQQLLGTDPLVAATGLLSVLYDSMVESMGRSAVRAALLMVFEKSHEQPMTFIERGDASRLLDQISQARRKVEGKPSLILPGAEH